MVKPALVPFYARAWHFANHPRRARQLVYLFWPWVRQRIARLFAENPADVIVSVHPLFNDVTLRYWMKAPRRVPFVIVICDIGSIHAPLVRERGPGHRPARGGAPAGHRLRGCRRSGWWSPASPSGCAFGKCGAGRKPSGGRNWAGGRISPPCW